MSWVGQTLSNEGKIIYLRNIQILPLFSGFIQVFLPQIRKFDLFNALSMENSKANPNILKLYHQWERL